ncbi:molybdenum cofactor biosynthesis protein MoaD [Clostridium carboxidivorans P7]|uniref:Thiamine S protein n=1 Tax=Clostridium carboxidivorans P7 TaxID=536227 RepID=C6PXF5_9CLOT|nr:MULTISPECIES: MoaD/ThiS family protein [Clostridium]AKN31675.1 molybdenum cofactor biosynthesis protein MoaD [Clostridium carboxidivorans P7]EET86081.1 thiamine S protein [Clostridium carboxidivorans P7]EFG87503.1 ThiS family protein [Clostridium carboxidivorans P7]WPC43673.1 MoaD/ThiS family protein [Clostridium sp. JS66]
MKLEVRLFATFREGREKKYFLDLNEGITPRDIVNMLKIDEEEVAILLINGRDGKLETVLHDNDIVSLFPPVGGG